LLKKRVIVVVIIIVGKSTVLRSVAAAALCGCVGLAIPAAPGSMLLQLDVVMLLPLPAVLLGCWLLCRQYHGADL
jgi:hypothetical protein